MLFDLFQSIIDALGALFSSIVGYLPASPFSSFNYVTMDNQFFGWLAYIVPISPIIATLQAWLVSISVFYVYIIVLRWIKAIE